VGANRRPAWVDLATPERPWNSLEGVVDGAPFEPYLVETRAAEDLRNRLREIGFDAVDIVFDPASSDPERSLLRSIGQGLSLDPVEVSNWPTYADRIGILLSGRESTPLAVIVNQSGELADRSMYHFVRCVHILLSLTEVSILNDPRANRQLEYFFVGDWSRTG
jgi:hypothetical protein